MGRVYSSREILQMLKADGWYLAAVVGDHHQYKHPTKPGRVTVQHPVKDLDKRVVASIFRQAKWK